MSVGKRDEMQLSTVKFDTDSGRAGVTVSHSYRATEYRKGKRVRGPVTVREKARMLLHRVGDEPRFIVWKVKSLPE
jgi:hypothetical protein